MSAEACIVLCQNSKIWSSSKASKWPLKAIFVMSIDCVTETWSSATIEEQILHLISNQEILHILWNQKCHCYVNNSFKHFPMQHKVNPFDALPYFFFKVHLLMFSHIYLCFENCLLFRLLHQCHIYISVHCVYVTCLCYPPCFHCPCNILWGEQSMKLLIQISLASFSGPNVLLSTPFSNTLIPCFTLIWETKIQTLIKLDAKYGNISYRQVKSVTVTTQHLHGQRLFIFSF